MLEPRLERVFHTSSYGYRPKKSAHQAIAKVRTNVRSNAWVIDLDIAAFFDNVDHAKLLLALDKHVEEKWIKMYIKRWLEAPIIKASGEVEEKQGKGTPQGGVISPLLANLYLHYTLDKWIEIQYSDLDFVRYADDIIIHCNTEKQAKELLKAVEKRLAVCRLKVAPQKTSIVYCRDYRRKEKGHKTKFDFLGFSFRPMSKKFKKGRMFLGYDCEVSKKSYSRIVKALRDMKIHRWSEGTLQDIAKELNPKLRGWIGYYDKFQYRALTKVFHRHHMRLIKWAVNKFKRLKGSWYRGLLYIKEVYRDYPSLFYHWHIGYHLV